MVAGTAYALNDLTQGQQQGQVGINRNDNTNQQGQGQQQGMVNENDLSNRNTNFNDLSNRNSQGQGQGQEQGQAQAAVAVQGQAQKTKQANAQNVNVNGDELNTYVMTAPNTVAGDGQTAAAAYSIFGGVNVSESDEYKVCIEKIRILSQMEAAGLITKEEAIDEAQLVYKQLKASTRPKRVLGILWKTRGRHILNGLGLFACDDFWAVGKED